MAVTLIRIGGEGFNYGSHHREYLMDSAGDVTSLPGIDECSPGSRAYTVDGKSVYRMDSTGAWVLSSSGGSGGGGGSGTITTPTSDEMAQWMLSVAEDGGYTGTAEEQKNSFAAVLNGMDDGSFPVIMQRGNRDEFPVPGVTNGLYIDTTDNVAYYWNETQNDYIGVIDMPATVTIVGGNAYGDYNT